VIGSRCPRQLDDAYAEMRQLLQPVPVSQLEGSVVSEELALVSLEHPPPLWSRNASIPPRPSTASQ
jgi:hypothetical protein